MRQTQRKPYKKVHVTMLLEYAGERRRDWSRQRCSSNLGNLVEELFSVPKMFEECRACVALAVLYRCFCFGSFPNEGKVQWNVYYLFGEDQHITLEDPKLQQYVIFAPLSVPNEIW